MNTESKNWPKRHPILTGILVVAGVLAFGSAGTSGDYSLIYFMGAVLAYFLPTLIASSKSKANTGAVFALNLLLGWTIIGWIIALVWALSNSATNQVITITNPTSQADELKKLADLKESGILSQEEFDLQKKAVLKS